MKTYYGVCTYNELDQPVWHYVDIQFGCLQYKAVMCAWVGVEDLPFMYIRELIGERDEVWAIRAEVARNRGEVEPLLYEDDELIGSTLGEDKEKDMDEQAWVFERYIELSKAREPYQEMWEKLRYRRSVWWSFFKEEMEWNWLELSVYERTSNHYLNPMNPNGIYSIESNKDKWSVFSWIWQGQVVVHSRCERLQNERRSFTYGIYERAMDATKKCQAFWKTKEGIALTRLNQERSDCWEMLKDLSCTWEDYNSLVNQEINLYWTSGETEDVDDMTLSMSTLYEILDIMEDTHSKEMDAMERGPSSSVGWWDWSVRNSPVYNVNIGHRTVVGPQGDTMLQKEDWDSLMSGWE
jgi:hypothetical protein